MADDDDKLCVVCLETPRETAFMPCRHTLCCEVCAALLKSCDDPCPFCREPIKSWVKGTYEEARMQESIIATRIKMTQHSSDEEETPRRVQTAPPTGHRSPAASHRSGPPSSCLVCHNTPPEVTLLPCGHEACCAICATILKDERRPCPSCRAPFTSCRLSGMPQLTYPRPPAGAVSSPPRPSRARSIQPGCSACLEPGPEILTSPCGHPVCLLCSIILRDRAQPCPACGAPVRGFTRSGKEYSPPRPSGPPAPPTRLAATVSKRLFYPTLGSRFKNNTAKDYQVQVTPGVQALVDNRAGAHLMYGKGYPLLSGFNYKFYVSPHNGSGPPEPGLQLKARGPSAKLYYELLSPPPKVVLATCKGLVTATHLHLQVWPRTEQAGPVLCEVLGALADGRFSVKGPTGELLGHVAEAKAPKGQVIYGVHVPADGDTLLLLMLAVLCTCLSSTPTVSSNSFVASSTTRRS